MLRFILGLYTHIDNKKMFGKKKKTALNYLKEDEEKIREQLDTFLKYKLRIERLIKLYPDVINSVDLFISKTLIIKNDTELPDEFLCSCKLLGLKVEDVERVTSYMSDCDFYIVVKFGGIIGDKIFKIKEAVPNAEK